MEKKNELAKEERTIFIVLAIIVLVAIGVLVTWYFTKDKDLEEKDKVTKDKTVETKKKDTSDLDEDSDYTYTPTDKVVVSDNVVEEEVEVVNVAEVAQAETGSIVNDESYDYRIPFYLVSDTVAFDNAVTMDETGEIVNINEGKIIKVKGYKDYTEDMITPEEIDVTGNYIINEDNTITFTANGVYGIVIQNSDGKEHEVYVRVYDNQQFNIMSNSFVDLILEDLQPINSYDANKYTEFMNALYDYKNFVGSDNDKRVAFGNLMSLFGELLETYNPNVTYGTGKAEEDKENEVTYGTGGASEGTVQTVVTYGTGGSEATLNEVTYGTGKAEEEIVNSVIYGTGKGPDEGSNNITYGTGIPA